MKKEDAKYILEAIEWMNENTTVASVDMETYGNLFMNSQSLLMDVVNGANSERKALHIDGVSGSAIPTLKEFSLGNFDNVAEIAQRLTSGNVAHHRNTIIGLAKRCSEFIRKHYR